MQALSFRVNPAKAAGTVLQILGQTGRHACLYCKKKSLKKKKHNLNSTDQIYLGPHQPKYQTCLLLDPPDMSTPPFKAHTPRQCSLQWARLRCFACFGFKLPPTWQAWQKNPNTFTETMFFCPRSSPTSHCLWGCKWRAATTAETSSVRDDTFGQPECFYLCKQLYL